MMWCAVGSEIPKRKLQSNNTTFTWLKLFNLLQLNKSDINMNLNTQI